VDGDDSLKIALDEMSGCVLRLVANLITQSLVDHASSDITPAVSKAAKKGELKDALKPITGDSNEEEEEEEEEEESLEIMFNKLSAHGADYLRQLGKMISDAVDSLDALVADEDEEEEEEDQEAKTKKEVITNPPKSKEAKQD